MVGRLAELVLYDIPLSFYERYVDDVLAVGPEAVRSLAREEMNPGEMVVVVVGDGATVEGPLSSLGLGPVEVVPAEEGASEPGGGAP